MSTRAGTRLVAPTQAARQGGHVTEMQRRRLLLAITEIVGESGLDAATVGRVCEQAGVSRRTFYEIFADREACLLAAFDAQVKRLSEVVAPEYIRAGSWARRVRRSLTLLLEHLDSEPDVARLLVVETLRTGPTVLERRRRVLDALAVVVDGGRAAARPGSEPPPLTARGVVGGALSVIQERLLSYSPTATGGSRVGGRQSVATVLPLVDLVGPLMAMIVHPYLGPTAARKELELKRPVSASPKPRAGADPFKGLPIRFTYRTARVISTIASEGGRGAYPSNRQIAESAGIADEGQTSRLLRRLQSHELIENRGEGHAKGEPNAWALTKRGEAIHAAISVQANA